MKTTLFILPFKKHIYSADTFKISFRIPDLSLDNPSVDDRDKNFPAPYDDIMLILLYYFTYLLVIQHDIWPPNVIRGYMQHIHTTVFSRVPTHFVIIPKLFHP